MTGTMMYGVDRQATVIMMKHGLGNRIARKIGMMALGTTLIGMAMMIGIVGIVGIDSEGEKDLLPSARRGA